MCSIFIRILIGCFCRYVEWNRKSYTQANELKVLYGDQLPTCLVDKPASVILHVLDQIKSSESAIYQVKMLLIFKWLILSEEKIFPKKPIQYY